MLVSPLCYCALNLFTGLKCICYCATSEERISSLIKYFAH